MKSVKEWKKTWNVLNSELIERRARLNELAAKGYSDCSEDEQNEHDALATLVAIDESNPNKGGEEDGS